METGTWPFFGSGLTTEVRQESGHHSFSISGLVQIHVLMLVLVDPGLEIPAGNWLGFYVKALAVCLEIGLMGFIISATTQFIINIQQNQ